MGATAIEERLRVLQVEGCGGEEQFAGSDDKLWPWNSNGIPYESGKEPEI
jgi:hypothetical protein